jgi:hypothetical protein
MLVALSTVRFSTAYSLEIPMKRSGLILFAALMASGSVMAQMPGGSPEMQAAREAMMKSCQADIKSLCSDKEGREMMMCLRSSNDKLSAGCKEAMSKMPARNPAP